MGYFDEFGNYIDDEQDTGGDFASQYYTPEQLAMMQQMMGQGTPQFDPMMGMDPQMTSMFGTMAMPQMDTKGRVQPWDLGTQTQTFNFGQDIGTSVAGNAGQIAAYLSGPSAYAPGALDPVWDETPLQLSATPTMQMYRQQGGLQGTLADLIMGDPANGVAGMNPNQAAARIRAMIESPEKFGRTAEDAAALTGELAPMIDQFGKSSGPDWKSLYTMADDLAKPYYAEQAMLRGPGVEYDPITGRAVKREQKPSPQMEYLTKLGLPDPRAQYDVEYALKSDPTLRSMLGSVASTQAERDMMRSEFEDRIKRMRKYREDDSKNAAEDAKRMEQYHGATKQALSDYFGAASRGLAARPEMPARASTVAAPLDPEMYNAQGLRRESYEEGPGGLPGWMKALPGNVAEGVTGLPDYASQTLQRIAGKPVAPAGAPRLPTNIGPLPDATAKPATINGITLDLPTRPLTSDMTTGLNPEGYSMMDQILGRPIRDVVNAKKTRTADEAISPAVRARLYSAQQKALDKKGVSAMTQYMLGLAPTVVAGRQGRSPRTDIIQQRLAPFYQMGALGQRA